MINNSLVNKSVFANIVDKPSLSIDEERKLFYNECAKSISAEDWRTMDKQDIIQLALVGDEPHLKDGRWNSWDDMED
jgi:hypothetical protein